MMKPGADSLMVVIGGKAPKKGPKLIDDKGSDEESAPDEDMQEAKESAAGVLAKAVKSGDEKAIAESFQALYDLCALSRGADEPDADDY